MAGGGHFVKHTYAVDVTTDVVNSTNSAYFTGTVREITFGPRVPSISSSNAWTFGRNTSGDLIMNPADAAVLPATTAATYTFSPSAPINTGASSGATVAKTSAGANAPYNPYILVDEFVRITIPPASSAFGGLTTSINVTLYVEGTAPSTAQA